MQATPPLANHFLEGRKWRADELGDAKLQGKAWWWQTRIKDGLLTLAILGLIIQGNRPAWKPYYIEIDRSSGAMRVIGPAPERYIPPQARAKASVRELVETLRGISPDKELQRERWIRQRIAMTPEGRKRLLVYEAERQPLRQQDPVKVEILRALPKPGSATTWDVRWQETDYSRDARDPQHRTIWSGLFSYQLREPRTQDELDFASDGIFWDFWQW